MIVKGGANHRQYNYALLLHLTSDYTMLQLIENSPNMRHLVSLERYQHAQCGDTFTLAESKHQ